MGRLISRLSPILQRRLSWDAAAGATSCVKTACTRSKDCYSLSYLLPGLSGSLTADFSTSGLIAAGRMHMTDHRTKAGASHSVTGVLSPEEVNTRLDFTPQLSKLQVAASLAVAAILCTVFHFWKAPQHMSPWHAIQVAAIAAVVLTLARSLFLEASYQAQSAPVEALKSHTSRFLDHHGMAIHYTSASSARAVPNQGGQAPRLVHAYHGFGANTASWAYADQGLADALGATFTAHDMPGFGLTQRSSKLADYTLEHNALVGRAVLDASQAQGPGLKEASAPNRVLIGHSLGGVCAALEAVRSPQDYEALVLVAPALMGGFGRVGQGKGRTGVISRSTHALNAVFGSGQLPSTVPVPRRAAWHQSWLAGLRAFASWAALAALQAVLWVLRPALVLALRSSVRSRAFWQRGLRSSWYRGGAQLPEELLNGYRLPQLLKGWESGLLRFLTCRISGGRSTWSALKEVFTTDHADRVVSTSTVHRLATLTSTHRLKVMIIHGEHDRLVPVKNSLRLAQQLPYIRLVVVPECGHSPQEECPERFISEVRDFLEDT